MMITASLCVAQELACILICLFDWLKVSEKNILAHWST